MTFWMEGAVSWAFGTFRIGVKCNKIGFSYPKIEMGGWGADIVTLLI